jgi:periplasmic mercuric ion binding protein
MKAIKMLFTVAILLATASFANAQSDKTERAQNFGLKTEKIKVSGTCDMDKRRIETAAYTTDGVKSADWNEYTQVLTLKYSVLKKDAADNAQKKIASVGNDTEKYRADDAVYQKLPDCCHYQRKQS